MLCPISDTEMKQRLAEITNLLLKSKSQLKKLPAFSKDKVNETIESAFGLTPNQGATV